DGNFEFNHLPNISFKVYALKDLDGGKTYNQKSEIFAFYEDVVHAFNPPEISLFAFAEEKFTEPATPPVKNKEWKLQTNLSNNRLDLLETLLLDYTNPILTDTTKNLQLRDSTNNLVALTVSPDSTR